MRSTKTPLITLAILCALWTHVFLFTDIGHRLQSSAVESLATTTADSTLSIEWNTLVWRIHTPYSRVHTITGTLQYDTTSLFVDTGTSSLGVLTETSLEWWKSLEITLSDQDIASGDILAQWDIVPVVPEIHTVNLLDVEIISQENAYQLTTTGTGEF